jgi:hypothetical protein
MESMQDVHTFAPSAICLERADLGIVLGVDPNSRVTRGHFDHSNANRVFIVALYLNRGLPESTVYDSSAINYCI